MLKHYNIYIIGKVQGVFFRSSAKERAIDLGLKGFVRNEVDGSVYVEAEGKEEKLQEFMEWCKKGSSSAKVENVLIKEGEVKNYPTFDII